MRELPIMFSAPMVRALLDGRKTQTRRVVKPQPPAAHNFAGYTTHSTHTPDEGKAVWGAGDVRALLRDAHRVRCPYGQPGDRLWVKETWRPRGAPGAYDSSLGAWDIEVTYAADGAQRIVRDGEFGEREWNMPKAAARGNVTPLFMPRWASRITLEITGVRVERLQAISDADAIAEGCPGGHGSIPAYGYNALPGEQFMALWNSINGADAWKANPWVWVVEFRRVGYSNA